MKIKDLIAHLKAMNPEAQVVGFDGEYGVWKNLSIRVCSDNEKRNLQHVLKEHEEIRKGEPHTPGLLVVEDETLENGLIIIG